MSIKDHSRTRINSPIIFFKIRQIVAFLLPSAIILALTLPALASHSTATAEQNHAKLVESEIESGDAVWLNDGNHEFLAIFSANKSGPLKGGTIILHDAGSHPNHSEVIRPIRTTLPLHGWATLSIQLPEIDQLDQYPEHQALVDNRIRAAIEHLNTQGVGNITLIAHGSGALNGAMFLANNQQNSIRAYVAISFGIVPGIDNTQSPLKLLEQINVPMLDIFGSLDLPFVTRSADARALAAKSSSGNESKRRLYESYKHTGLAMEAGAKVQGYIAYRQIKIAGANHRFIGKNNILAKRVVGWLDRHAKGAMIQSKPMISQSNNAKTN